MTKSVISQVADTISEFNGLIERQMAQWLSVRDAKAFREMEMEVSKHTRDLADKIVGKIFKAIIMDSNHQQQTAEALRKTGKFRNGGYRTTGATLLGGHQVSVKTLYLKPDRRGRRGRVRGVGKRGRAGEGCYPALASLGIGYGVTPAAATEICRQVADSDSVRSGREALSRRGLDLGHKQTLRIVNHISQRAVHQREQMIEEAIRSAPISGTLRNKRVVIAVDGGRIRQRVPKLGRRRKKSRHFGYDTPWREPKLFVIYTIDEEGRPESIFRPVCDGTMNDCDAVFRLMLGYKV